MKTPSTGVLALTLIAATAVTLSAIGAPHDRVPAPAAVPAAPAAAGVAAGGFTLRSANVDLPSDDARLPDGPHADLVNASCTACHSASMVLNQPALSADQWKATVTKMREAYKAPIAEGDVAAIVAYLTALPGQTAQLPTGKAQDPDPKAAPRLPTG